MSLSTKEINVGGNFVSKVLVPGEHKAKINSVTLEQNQFKEGSYYVVLHLEGPPMGPDFEGFLIDKDDETSGHYLGQIGKVRTHDYSYADNVLDSGVVIKRDIEIMKAIKNLCKAMDIIKWFDAQDKIHDTIHDFVNKFNEDKPYNDIWMNYCLAGKEYTNKNGYTNYDLYLPKFNKGHVPYELVDTAPSKLILFNAKVHIKAPSKKSVKNFSNDDLLDDVSDASAKKTDDFEL